MVKEIKRWWPLFVLPTALSFLFGFVIPFAQGLYLSFCEFITVGNAKFVGLRNYVDALADTQFTASFFFTVAFTVVSVVLINVIALAIAQALTRKGLKGTNAFRTVFFMPNLIPTITICLFLSLTNGFKLFDQNLALTGGEPAHSTEMLALNIFNTFYSRSGIKWMGIGQAKAVIFCILVVVIALVQLRATQSKEVEQ